MFDKAVQFVLTFLTIKQIFNEVNRETTGTEADTGERGDGAVYGDSPADTATPQDSSRPTS